MTDNSRFDCETCGDLRSVPATLPCPACARVTGEQALALAGWIEGNVWQDSTVDVADLLRVLAVSNDQGRADQQQEGLTMPSEQPPTRVESGTSIEEAERLAAIETDAVFGPAQPQPRGERARVDKCPTCSCTLEHGRGYRYYGKGNGEMACDDKWHAESTFNDPAPPRGERDDLAARLEARADNADKMAAEVARNPSNYGESGPRHHARLLAAAYAFRKAAEMARASTHPEQGETRAFERGVREACRLMRHVDTLDKVPGARDGLPHLNPLWDGSAYVEDALVGPFADRIQRPAPEGEGDDLAARTVQIIRNRAKIAREQGTTEAQIIRARALDEAANEFADILPALRASTHPEQWVSGDDREWLLWITSYVLNRHEFTDSAATDARAALTRIATAIKQPPTPTEQGEDRTRVEWHDGIEHGDELALRQLAANIGCGIPYGCQPSVGKWYAAALDRVLDRLLPLDPAPEQGEARVEASENDDRKEVP